MILVAGSTAGSFSWKTKANAGFATVATSGSYNDLSNTPSSLPASDVSAWAKEATKPSYTASEVGAVPTTRTVNSKALSADISLTASDVGAATSGHTHSLSIASSTDTNQITLSANTKYKLTAGGSTYVFTTPAGGSSTDTKNTAGATNSTSKLFLVGATSQGDNPVTYSNSSVYATNGALTAYSFNATSAKKFKEDIKAFDSSALDIVNKTDIVSFVFKDDEDKTKRIGFIADDADELISTKSHCYMDMYNCIGVLFKAVQELSAEVERLKNNG